MTNPLRAVTARLFLLPLLLAPSIASAQDPPLPDSLPVMAPDSMAADSVDARPLAVFPPMPVAGPAGFRAGTWAWDREALLRETVVSLADLLERIPGVTALRTGVYVQPQTAAAFGGTAGRVEIELDGFVLDPLAASSLDLAQIPLGQLAEVRVERRLGLLRIRLTTERPADNQPYSRIEAGIGEPFGNVFRGVFLVPHVIIGPLGLAVERVDSDGFRRNEPGDVFSGWAKWAWTDSVRGVQLEFLQSRVRREPQSPWLTDRTRRDVILRARNAFSDLLTAEVYAGRSTVDETVPGTATDTTPDYAFERASLQAGARAAVGTERAVLSGILRFRSAEQLPTTEAVLAADVDIGPVRGGAEVGRADWPDAGAANYASAHAELAPLPPSSAVGASVFAEVTRGSRGFPVYAGDDDEADVGQSMLSSREGWRAGASLRLGQRASGGAAFISLDAGESRPFGLPFDSGGAVGPASDARGVEAHGRLVLVPDVLTLESWITNWSDLTGWAYLPARTWRTALGVHTLPLPSGNLEILARLEASHRSGMMAYSVAGDGADAGVANELVGVPAYTVAHGYLHIRIIDVRIFLRWEDLLTRQPEVLPGRVLTGPRILYGVKWTLRN